jgi:hypothetical protein
MKLTSHNQFHFNMQENENLCHVDNLGTDVDNTITINKNDKLIVDETVFVQRNEQCPPELEISPGYVNSEAEEKRKRALLMNYNQNSNQPTAALVYRGDYIQGLLESKNGREWVDRKYRVRPNLTDPVTLKYKLTNKHGTSTYYVVASTHELDEIKWHGEWGRLAAVPPHLLRISEPFVLCPSLLWLHVDHDKKMLVCTGAD